MRRRRHPGDARLVAGLRGRKLQLAGAALFGDVFAGGAVREVFVLWCPAIREGCILIQSGRAELRYGLAGRGAGAGRRRGRTGARSGAHCSSARRFLPAAVVPRPLRALGQSPCFPRPRTAVLDPFIDTFAVLVHPRITTIRNRVRILRHGEEQTTPSARASAYPAQVTGRCVRVRRRLPLGPSNG